MTFKPTEPPGRGCRDFFQGWAGMDQMGEAPLPDPICRFRTVISLSSQAAGQGRTGEAEPRGKALPTGSHCLQGAPLSPSDGVDPAPALWDLLRKRNLPLLSAFLNILVPERDKRGREMSRCSEHTGDSSSQELGRGPRARRKVSPGWGGSRVKVGRLGWEPAAWMEVRQNWSQGWVRREEVMQQRDEAGAQAQELGFLWITTNRKRTPRKPGLIYFFHF